MTPQEKSSLSPLDVFDTLTRQWKLWVVPTVVMTIVAATYSLLKSNVWEASQALMVRQQASGSDRGGAFADVTEMKTVQETILELAKSKSVLKAALEEVGPPASFLRPRNWPSASNISDLRGRLQMTPPKGAEFGKTEVFYIKVKDTNQNRAVAVAEALCNQLEARFQVLRDTKAQSMIDELIRTVSLAEADLESDTRRLAKFEQEVGPDLSELRILHASPSGSSDVRQKLVAVENELRQQKAAQRQNERLLEVLSAAVDDPDHLVASPNSLLQSQPALRRLKDGLVDAQLRTAQLRGSMSEEHPLVQAAVASEQEIREHLHNELTLAIRGVRIELRLSTDRVEALNNQLANNRSRLRRLAGLRADYANLIASTQNRTQLVEAARSDLAEARGSQAAARSTSLIGRIDAPDTGTSPVGPGKKFITLVGCLGGLVTGLGLVFLVATPGTTGTGHAPASSATLDELARFSDQGASIKEALLKLIQERFSTNRFSTNGHGKETR